MNIIFNSLRKVPNFFEPFFTNPYFFQKLLYNKRNLSRKENHGDRRC